uniref:Pathogen-related protein 1 alternative isoform n=1 Tax=Cucumis melo var. inodorus TaxID=357961 RepID=B2ZPN3_CUCME|nr:pathogen-related protein 1 alternative isoform [Cucumis melo var. inodorus]
MLPFSFAQDSIKDFVDAHNAARAQVGVGPVHWNKTVADYAHQYANKRIKDCNLVHSKGPYGENIAWGSRNLADVWPLHSSGVETFCENWMCKSEM